MKGAMKGAFQVSYELDAAVVVASFRGFLALHERFVDGRTKKGAGAGNDEGAVALAGAIDDCLGKAVDAVHASGGDVVRLGYDGVVCVFPMSGSPGRRKGGGRDDDVDSDDDDDGGARGGREWGNRDRDAAADATRAAGATLRAMKCAFTLVSQLSSSTPELAVRADDGESAGATTTTSPRVEQIWPGLRRHSAGLRVLVVEALQLSRMTLGRLLDHFGCMPHFAENASQAAAACANMEFDVVLVDLMLPDLDGYEVARHVRNNAGPVNARAFICALTAVDQPELLEQCLKAGMDEVVAKPASMTSLQETFRKARRLKAEARRIRRAEAATRRSLKNGPGAATPPSKSSPSAPVLASAARDPWAPGERPTSSRASIDVSSRARALPASTPRDAAGGPAADASHVVLTEDNEKCVPVSMPRFADMLASSNARGARKGSTRDDAGGGGGGGGGGGKKSGAWTRFFSSLCGRGGGGEKKKSEYSDGSYDGSGGVKIAARDDSDVKLALKNLAKHKGDAVARDDASRRGGASWSSSSDDDDDDDARAAGRGMPVCVTVTASVGFGKVSMIRVGNGLASSVTTTTNAGGQSASCDFRDEIVALDAPLGMEPYASAAASAAFGPAHGGPFQQVATLSSLATDGDVVLSPVAWRLVREHCECDAPPRLRGGARLNRLRVHEVVPPLTHHALATNQFASLIPRRPDATRALAAIEGLVPRPLRVALAEQSTATAAALSALRTARVEKMKKRDDAAAKAKAANAANGETADRQSIDEDADDDATAAIVMPGAPARYVDAVTVCLYLPGCSSAARGHVVVPADTPSVASAFTTAASSVVELLARFPGSTLVRVTSDVLLRKDAADGGTGGGGGGGEVRSIHWSPYDPVGVVNAVP